MKLNRKWIMVLALVMSMAMATTGTLAYLTDRDSEANVFTMGNVEIDLNEEFDPEGAELIPGLDIEKKPTITNTGKNDAWVWATIAIPSKLDSSDASKNIVHFNFSKESVADGLWKWTDENGEYMVEIGKKIDDTDILYNVYTVLYETPLKPGETTTEPVMTKVYMDYHIDIDTKGDVYHVENGEVTGPYWNVNTDGKPVIYVSAYAIQTEGFANVQAGYAAYNAQWGDKGAEYGAADDEIDSEIPVIPGVTATSTEELAAAIEAGETVIGLAAGEYTIPAEAKGKTLTLKGAGADKTTITVVPAGQGEANGQLDYSLDGSTVVFEDLTIKTNSQLYAGYARLSGTYNNCTIQNTYNLGVGNSEFNNCTFNITNEYLRVNGAYKATFNNCTFNTDGRAILVFQDGTDAAQVVTVKDCTFNATAPAYTWNGIHVAAVSIDSTQGTSYEVNFEGNNVVDDDFAGLVQIKTQVKPITINGATPTELTYKQ